MLKYNVDFGSYQLDEPAKLYDILIQMNFGNRFNCPVRKEISCREDPEEVLQYKE